MVDWFFLVRPIDMGSGRSVGSEIDTDLLRGLLWLHRVVPE
jgi:hypothetical protein